VASFGISLMQGNLQKKPAMERKKARFGGDHPTVDQLLAQQIPCAAEQRN
jgi:hypothetical protein